MTTASLNPALPGVRVNTRDLAAEIMEAYKAYQREADRIKGLDTEAKDLRKQHTEAKEDNRPLDLLFDLGRKLNEGKAEAGEAKGALSRWLKVKKIVIPKSTRKLAMRLARNEEAIRANLVGLTLAPTISNARDKCCPKTPQEQRDADERKAKDERKKHEKKLANRSEDLEVLIPATAPDELMSVIKRAWGDVHQRRLHQILSEHLGAARAPVPPPPAPLVAAPRPVG
jgi:hypothetical protein